MAGDHKSNPVAVGVPVDDGLVGINGKRRQPTIVDVANMADVAIGTVSRYLNGFSVRRANRDQIEEAIEKLGYKRNAVAAAMKTDLTHVIGFMVPTFDEFHGVMLEHLSRAIRLGPPSTTAISRVAPRCMLAASVKPAAAV